MLHPKDNFARRAKPLTLLTKKCSPDKLTHVWSAEQEQSFQDLKTAMLSVKLLNFIDYSNPVCIRTDASKDGCGSMLYQVAGGIEQLLRGRLRLQEYDFIVRHVAGKDNVVADALSRVGIDPAAKTVRFAAAAVKDIQYDPKLLKSVADFHNDIQGHLKCRQVEQKMREAGFSGANLRQHITHVISACGLCQKLDASAALASPVAGIAARECGEEWSLDTIGPLEEDEDGNQYVIVAICGFSRMVFSKACKTVTAAEAAQFILELAAIFGLPKTFRTDNGPQYDNALIHSLLELVGSERYPGIAYRPQSNGLVERVNKEVSRHLRFIVHARRKRGHWSRYLPLVCRIINSSYNSAIGTSPLRVMFGGHVTPNRCLVKPVNQNKAQKIISSISDSNRQKFISEYIQHLIEAQKEIDAQSAEYQHGILLKRIANASPTDVLSKGSWVVCSWPSGRPSKLSVLWKGPYRILGLKDGSTSVYNCEDPADLMVYDFHVSRLRKYQLGAADPKELIALDTEEYVVDCFIDHNCPGSKKSDWDFKVRWKGMPEEEDSWIPWREAKKLSAMDAYQAAHPELNISPA